MLHLIPAPVHRAGYRFAHRARRLWLRFSKAPVEGCSIIARDSEERILLVRHSYGPPVWAFPGGGMKKGEDPQLAALREFAEELRCAIIDPLHVGTLQEEWHGTVNTAHIFTGLIEGDPRPDMREIVVARFFHRDELPHNLARSVARRLALLDQA